MELASGKLLLTLNPFFNAQVGDSRQTDGLGFEYGWRAEYAFAKRWGIGVEMFGEIEESPTPAHSTISRTASVQRCSTTPGTKITLKATMTITPARPRWKCL